MALELKEAADLLASKSEKEKKEAAEKKKKKDDELRNSARAAREKATREQGRHRSHATGEALGWFSRFCNRCAFSLF